MFKLLPILMLLSALLIGGSLVSSTERKGLQDDIIVSLSKTQVLIPCICDDVLFGLPRSNKESLDDILRVRVKTTSNRPDHRSLSYNYQVNGGEIIGHGSEVDWDFSNTAPGKYSLTVHIFNASGGLIATITRDIDLEALNCHCPCDCPILSVESPFVSARHDQPIDFEAFVIDGPATEIKYKWTVNGGVVKSGQGTPSIVVTHSARSRANSVTAKVEISGPDPICACQTVAEASVPFGSRTVIQDRHPDVIALDIDETDLVLPCSPGLRPLEGTRISDDMRIAVSAKAVARGNDVLTYNYTVSGGMIIGSGAKVEWDLTGVQPGTYQIAAGVNDGSGIRGKTETATVTVTECPSNIDPDCPSLSIAGPDSISNLRPSVFTANISGFVGSPAYHWTVVNGKIIDGQDTPSITAKMPANSSEPSSVSVKIGGLGLDPEFGCRTEETLSYENGILKR